MSAGPTRDSLVLFGEPEARRRGPGRPVAPPTTPVATRVPDAVYDRLVAEANRRGVSVAAFVRAAVLGALRPRR